MLFARQGSQEGEVEEVARFAATTFKYDQAVMWRFSRQQPDLALNHWPSIYAARSGTLVRNGM